MNFSVRFGFSRSYTFGRTPWVGDQLVARPLPVHKHRKTHTHFTLIQDYKSERISSLIFKDLQYYFIYLSLIYYIYDKVKFIYIKFITSVEKPARTFIVIRKFDTLMSTNIWTALSELGRIKNLLVSYFWKACFIYMLIRRHGAHFLFLL
jgi:hypothetical protein